MVWEWRKCGEGGRGVVWRREEVRSCVEEWPGLPHTHTCERVVAVASGGEAVGQVAANGVRRTAAQQERELSQQERAPVGVSCLRMESSWITALYGIEHWRDRAWILVWYVKGRRATELMTGRARAVCGAALGVHMWHGLRPRVCTWQGGEEGAPLPSTAGGTGGDGGQAVVAVMMVMMGTGQALARRQGCGRMHAGTA